ncbi:SNF2 domain-containing protein [Maricaulis maris]|uniref:SNF2 domain-containing protein n=1 Tax=Maricaulis maris TaxID=74318 RepID=A0A495D397_9PROT|nr:SNF2 domain-containing protein [Maricaulis maris]
MKYGKLIRTETGWRMEDVPAHVSLRLKQIFPRLDKAARGTFEFPGDDVTAADLDWFRDRYPFLIEPEANQALIRGRLAHEERQSETERLFLNGFKPPTYAGLQPGQTVRRYQAQAVEMLRLSGGLLLGDDVGLGKTFTTCAAMLVPGALPAVVVCQPHLQRQWCRVIESFTTLKAHAVKKTSPYTLPKADVLVFRYTQLAGWVEQFPELAPRLVAFDEIQELRKGEEALKGRAALELVRSADYRVGLSATPIYNKGAEIWTIYQYLAPDVLGPFMEFQREWCGYGYWVADPVALGDYLRDGHVFLRRTKADVGQELPKVSRIIEYIEHDAGELAKIEDVARRLALTATTSDSFHERGQAARDLDLRLRHATGVAKARVVAAMARVLVESGEPVIMAGWHRDVYDIWSEALHDLEPAYYTGTETAAAKQREVDRFVSGETNLMFMSLRSGAGVDGLQLRCSTMIIGELDWSPATHTQIIGRLDREGQTQPVTAIFPVASDGSDPPMMELNGLKASQAAGITDRGVAQAASTDRTRLQALVGRYLKGGTG